jgi:tetratricopeptide (TPR) repeat protein
LAKWTVFPHLGDFQFEAGSIGKLWNRLHAGDAEPLPQDQRVLQAWALFHNGEFQQAAEAGLAAGGAGITAANKATAIYANYLEKKEKTRLDLFLEVAQRAEAQAQADPKNPNAWYWQAYQLQPRHADAHIALGAFHAEVIDKVGSLIGGMTYGAKKDIGLKLFQQALKLNPASAIGLIEYANGLVMLEGDPKMKEATKLYEQAAASQPMDATERLDVELAKVELRD